MREYVLMQELNAENYWYGYFENTSCFWSNWHKFESDAISSNLHFIEDYPETLDSFLSNPRCNVTLLYRSTEPITINTHPEYFI